jgi:signal recognition particle receptor subunit beta
MAQFSEQSRELAVKVVYYGPALSGKTTNLQALYQKMDPKVRGRLMTLDTKDDRTLFFDMMPVFFKTPGGVKVKIKLYTVPGQVMHESTRRIVLQGSDAVVFVADARKSEIAPTLAYWKDMVRNLEANGLDPRALPIVIQKNKMDLEGIREDEFTDLARSPRVPVIPAKAIAGEGVLETLDALLTLCYRDLDRSLGLARRFALSEKEFLGSVLSRVEAR